MLCKVRSLGLQGISGYEVTAECDLAGGLPNFDIVGLPDTAVKEARERVRAAIKNSGYAFPVGRITVNLAPANRRKSGTVYDLPILVGILTAAGQLDWSDPHCAFVGELSLSGTLRPVVGMLPMALAARAAGIRRLFVPADSAPEATLAQGLTVYPVETVGQLADHLAGRAPIDPAPVWQGGEEDLPLPDFAEVRGQGPVKRVLEIDQPGGLAKQVPDGVFQPGKREVNQRAHGVSFPPSVMAKKRSSRLRVCSSSGRLYWVAAKRPFIMMWVTSQ